MMKEIMNGKPGQAVCCSTSTSLSFFCSVIDTLKGSYYANPIVDKPSVSRSEQEKYPEYYGQNICKDFPVMLVYIHEVTNASKRARER